MLPALSMGEMVAGAPLDYSFKELKSVLEMETEEPRSGGKRRPPEQKETAAAGQAETGVDPSATGVSAVTTAGTVAVADAAKGATGGSMNPAGQPGLSKNQTGLGQMRQNAAPLIKRRIRKVTIAVKLNNNSIDSLAELPQALEFVMEDPLRNLQWLDMSFNRLTSIQPELLDFKQMKALYMHGNQIQSLPSVERLRKLPKLISLTLNGNPIECFPSYRRYVVGALHELRSLDHSTITDDEVKGAIEWFKGHQQRAAERKQRLEDAALENNE
jgi:hypothetical protein